MNKTMIKSILIRKFLKFLRVKFHIKTITTKVIYIRIFYIFTCEIKLLLQLM